MQAVTSWADVAFSSAERDRHLGIRPVSQLNTWPVVSPVNASRRPSRDAVHHSGSGRMASPYPMGDFHLLFFASLPGALCLLVTLAMSEVLKHGLFSVALQAYGSAFFDWDGVS